MLIKRTILWLGTVSLILAVGLPALAQDLAGLQLFAPVEASPYGGGAKPKDGFFFVWDGLRWYTSKPDIATVKFEGLPNPFDTGIMRSFSRSGDRFELGRIRGQHGWMVDILHVKPQTQYLYLTGVKARNSVSTWSVELMYIHRSKQRHHGGSFEWFAGMRYMELDEDFNVDVEGLEGVEGVEGEEGEEGEEDVEGVDAVEGVDSANLYTRAENHITGPQVGLRWFRKRGRWMLSTEGRFFAGYNSQIIRQQGALGDIARQVDEWSPCAELRAGVRFQATRSVSFRVGWTGTWLDNIARSSNMVNYEFPTTDAIGNGRRQDVFIHGLTIGIDINR
jgi:hypothetical protein